MSKTVITMITATVFVGLLFWLIYEIHHSQNNISSIDCNELIAMTHKYKAKFFYVKKTDKWLNFIEANTCCERLNTYLGLGYIDISKNMLFEFSDGLCPKALFRVELMEEIPIMT